ncbi:helix-turn-helix domain-containing protein [Mycobacterium sp.]|uniref:helix-turn-helix domain-containing protein n=1 Tax=Mycobacterium sp. TaxID=1785 RepID=UPI00344C1C50
MRTRALDAAALITESGLAATAFEAIVDRAGFSIPSLYVSFGTRDGLLCVIFERRSPRPKSSISWPETQGTFALQFGGCMG